MRLRKAGREQAAILLAEGRVSDQKIADSVGVSRRSLERWKNEPEFDARVSQIADELCARAKKFAIARVEGRMIVRQEMENKLLTVFAERAQEAAETNSDVPGLRTGLVCKTLKGIGKGEDFQVVEEYEVDTGSIRELRGLHEDAAKDMGQLEEAKVRAHINLADEISEARKRAQAAKTYAIPSPNVPNSQKETKDRVN